MHKQITFDLRQAGIISFTVGVIMFFGQSYLGGGLLYLSPLVAEDQAANNVISGALLTVWSGAFVLILAGAILFFIGRRKVKASDPAAT